MSDRLPFRWSVVAGLATVATAFAFGLPLPLSTLLGAVVLAVVPLKWVSHVAPDGRQPLPEQRRREGTRRELTWLSWAHDARRRTMGEAAVRQLAGHARRRLADLDIDVDDPAHAEAAARTLGSPAYEQLLAGTIQGPMSERRFARCLDAVERLADLRQHREIGATTRSTAR